MTDMRFGVAAVSAILALVPGAVFAASPAPAKPEHARAPVVSLWSPALAKTGEFNALEDGFTNGGTLASGDVDGDGNVDLVVGAGPGRLPEVRIFSVTGELKKTFRAYPDWFLGGVRVAVGDLDGDGKAEIITAPGPGMEPQINVFGADGSQVVPGGVWAYGKGFQGGVHVATGDLDGDGRSEIITAPGPGGGPHVRVWNGKMESVSDFFAYDPGMTDGVTITTLKTKWGAAIVTGVESWTSPLVRRFAADGKLLKEFYAYGTSTRSGVSVTGWDMDQDGTDEIVTTPNGSAFADLRVYDLYGTEYRRVNALDADYRGALSVAPVPSGLATMPLAAVVSGPLDKERTIEVNLIQQRLYAYEHGRVARTFSVSTGLARFPTPEMAVSVTEKIPVKRYRWNYGPGNPNNYDLPNVKWNLRILGPYHIHHAYWHNNFGNRMSHGCINVGQADAEWVYNWASVGTSVRVYNGTAVEKAAGVRIATKGVHP
jgi:lipoprotein-anchoring transpeptidase ErfK/SrfK